VDRFADDGTTVSDDELETLAMAADPDRPLDADAVPFAVPGDEPSGLLPDWYMPVATAPVRGRVRRVVVGGVVAGLLAVNAVGLCVTSGFVELAW
jgi:hypothetical protein